MADRGDEEEHACACINGTLSHPYPCACQAAARVCNDIIGALRGDKER